MKTITFQVKLTLDRDEDLYPGQLDRIADNIAQVLFDEDTFVHLLDDAGVQYALAQGLVVGWVYP